MEVKQIGNCMENGKRKNPNQGRVYDQNGLSPTLTDMQGGGQTTNDYRNSKNQTSHIPRIHRVRNRWSGRFIIPG